MFNYSQWLVDFLAKAAGHKYIKRVPYMSGGKTRYRYIYHVGQMHQGKRVLDPEHMTVGEPQRNAFDTEHFARLKAALVQKNPKAVADAVSDTLEHMEMEEHEPEFRSADAVALGRDPRASDRIKHSLEKAAALPEVLGGLDLEEWVSPTIRESARAVSLVASEFMSSALEQVRTELEKQSTQHRRAIEHTKGASKALEEYARYAVEAGAAGKRSAAAEYVQESDLRRKGEPALVRLLTDSAERIERTLSDESALRRAIFETIKAKSLASRTPRVSAMNANIDNVLEAMRALV